MIEILERLKYCIGKDFKVVKLYDWFIVVIFVVCDCVIDNWMDLIKCIYVEGCKCVYYFLLEFFIGCLMCDMMINIGIMDEM